MGLNEPIVDASAPLGPGMGGPGKISMYPAARFGQIATVSPQQRALLAQQLNMTPEGQTQMMHVTAQVPLEAQIFFFVS